MSQRDTIVHLVAGGAGGTAGAIVTCPLEVVKTRLQSSVATFDRGHHHHQSGHSSALRSASVRAHTGRVYTGVGGDAVMQQQQQQAEMRYHLSTCSSSASNGSASAVLRGSSPSALYGTLTESSGNVPRRPTSLGVWRCLRCIVETEGPKALFKGLGPNLVGVAPSRAIYFYTYSSAKNIFNDQLTPDSASVHMCSAVCAGFAACTTTNPIWFVKTRLQLDQKKNGGLTTLDCVRDIYRRKGIAGFYKGITASYFGISETVIHFVIYEAIKARLRDRRVDCGNEKTASDFAEYMLAGATSKTCASIIAYPHEVARTRLRQDGDKYRSFWQTLVTVFREEGHRGVYRGLGTQLIRQIPNTALMMATYEAVVYLLSNPPNHQDDGGGGDSSGVDVAGEFCCAEVERNGG